MNWGREDRSHTDVEVGKIDYQKAFGQAAPDQPLTLETTFWIASCTKLLTSIAVLQCVEKGLIGLDDDVAPILHELKGIQILKGFDPTSGKPILQTAKKAITLRYVVPCHHYGIDELTIG